jgi:hypothetical protein
MSAKKQPREDDPKIGRPLIKIDPATVGTLAGIGCSNKEIAAVVGCSVDTLADRFSMEIEKGKENGKTRLRKKQFELALGGNVALLIWLGKQMLGQAEKVEAKTEHTGNVNGTLSKEDAEAVSAWAADIRKHIRGTRTHKTK